jgi:hypothetical protein
MALTTCVQCEGQVASDAKFCPHCGSRAPRVWTPLLAFTAWSLVIGIVGVVTTVTLLVVLVPPPH